MKNEEVHELLVLDNLNYILRNLSELDRKIDLISEAIADLNNEIEAITPKESTR